MTDTSALVAFIKARLDEDEQSAQAATSGPWRYNPGKQWFDIEPKPLRDAAARAGVQGEEFVGAGPLDATIGVAATGPADDPQSMADAAFIARHDPARVLRELEAKRLILAEHEPGWRTVEWPHDQDGKGHAQVCRRCQNAEHTEWHPAEGQAGVLPEGFVAPYVVAPCETLRLLALPYAEHPDYREEWRP